MNRFRKFITAVALVAVAIVVPVAATADTLVKTSAETTVANATRNPGSNNWSPATTASYNQVVAVQVVYNNNEEPSSTKVAKNVHVKINIPSKAGANQTITTKTSSDNGKTINGTGTVTLDRADAYLQYIPGTATWKHANTANGPLTVTQKVSDDVVLSANGINLGDEQPCQAGSIVVMARVLVPGLTVDKYVRHQTTATGGWTRSITAKDGDVLQYEIEYHNTGNTTQNNVEFRDQLPKGVTYIPGTTRVRSPAYPNGHTVQSDALTTNGIVFGNYAPGAAAYFIFDVKVDASVLTCGNNNVRNTAIVQPQGMNYYYNTADVLVNKVCNNTPNYACTAFGATAGDNRTVTVNKYQFSATNGATFNNVVVDWGDGSTPLTTDATNVVNASHQYANNGNYAVVATSHFTVDGKDVTAGGCSQIVNYTGNGTPTPVVTTGKLTSTGPGQVFALFAAMAVAGTVASRLFLSRRSN